MIKEHRECLSQCPECFASQRFVILRNHLLWFHQRCIRTETFLWYKYSVAVPLDSNMYMELNNFSYCALFETVKKKSLGK